MNSQDSPRPRFGGTTTFPLIIFYVSNHEAIIQMSFCLQTPNGSLEIPKIESPMILEAYNFVCKPPIEMRSKSKL
jgi:hypothetical protein